MKHKTVTICMTIKIGVTGVIKLVFVKIVQVKKQCHVLRDKGVQRVKQI